MRKSAIITTLFNHIDNPYFFHNWQKFINSLKQHNLLEHLFVCEVLPQDTQSMIDTSQLNHWTIYNNSYLWHKETAFNYLLSKIPNKYNAIIAMDNDIICKNNDWYDTTCNLLDNYVAVQPYATIEYLLHDNTNIDLIDCGIVNTCQTSSAMTAGNPGLLVAYKKEYLQHMGGFYDRCLVGGGDIINMLPFYVTTHAIPFDIFDMVTNDCVSSVVDYISRGKQFLQQQSCRYINYYSDNSITHLFHGYWSDRNYHNRYKILNTLNLQESFQKNSNQFYEIKQDSVHSQFKDFFHNRLSIFKNNSSIIVCSSKYKTDEDHVFWLKPQTTLSCYNIQNIEIVLNKQQDLGHIEIYINNEAINIETLMNSNQQTLTYSHPSIITINCEKKMQAPLDRRELGLFISSIRIIPTTSMTDAWDVYKLKNIL